MYHAVLLALFLAASVHRPTRSVWLCVSAVTASDMLARHFYGQDDYQLYVIRSAAAFIGATWLVSVRCALARWHLGIYVLTLLAYLGLAVDVALGTYSIFYETIYEAVIYGLVACQIIAVAPTVRIAVVHSGAALATMLEHLHRGKKT